MLDGRNELRRVWIVVQTHMRYLAMKQLIYKGCEYAQVQGSELEHCADIRFNKASLDFFRNASAQKSVDQLVYIGTISPYFGALPSNVAESAQGLMPCECLKLDSTADAIMKHCSFLDFASKPKRQENRFLTKPQLHLDWGQ